MSTAPAQPNFPRPPGPERAGAGADHPARRARQVAGIAAAGTVAALTGFFAVRAAQADDTSAPTSATPTDTAGSDTGIPGEAAPGGGDASTNPWAGVDHDNGAGYDRGFDIDGDGDRPAPPDGGFGRGGQPGSGAAATPALPGGGSNSGSGGS